MIGQVGVSLCYWIDQLMEQLMLQLTATVNDKGKL